MNRELSRARLQRAHPRAAPRTSARPPLERARFLAIFSRNLDEFFQIRVSGLREQLAAGVPGTSPDGMSPREQLDAIRARAQELAARQMQVFEKQVRPQLHADRIRIADWDELKKAAARGAPRRSSRSGCSPC